MRIASFVVVAGLLLVASCPVRAWGAPSDPDPPAAVTGGASGEPTGGAVPGEVDAPPSHTSPAPSGGSDEPQVGTHGPSVRVPAPPRPAAPGASRRPGSAPQRRSGTVPSADRSHPGADALARWSRVPAFLLPIFRAAGKRYGVWWAVLAAINEVETNYGRNLNVSSAGAVGWMQFMPATWRAYGVDGNGDGRADPYNPFDAIFAAARYLSAAGYGNDMRAAIFAYNHADWYVRSVLLRARLLAALGRALLEPRGGLAGGRFPIAARALYRGGVGRSIDVFANLLAPVVAVTDGVVTRLGETERGERYLVLSDARGNRYRYSGFASVARRYPAPRPATARPITRRPPAANRPERLFAHPWRPNAWRAGGIEQTFGDRAAAAGFTTYTNPRLGALEADARNARPKPLRPGAHVVAGTVLGRIGRERPGLAARLRFAIWKGGRGRRPVDPKAVLDAWSEREARRAEKPTRIGASRRKPAARMEFRKRQQHPAAAAR